MQAHAGGLSTAAGTDDLLLTAGLDGSICCWAEFQLLAQGPGAVSAAAMPLTTSHGNLSQQVRQQATCVGQHPAHSLGPGNCWAASCGVSISCMCHHITSSIFPQLHRSKASPLAYKISVTKFLARNSLSVRQKTPFAQQEKHGWGSTSALLCHAYLLLSLTSAALLVMPPRFSPYTSARLQARSACFADDELALQPSQWSVCHQCGASRSQKQPGPASLCWIRSSPV